MMVEVTDLPLSSDAITVNALMGRPEFRRKLQWMKQNGYPLEWTEDKGWTKSTFLVTAPDHILSGLRLVRLIYANMSMNDFYYEEVPFQVPYQAGRECRRHHH